MRKLQAILLILIPLSLFLSCFIYEAFIKEDPKIVIANNERIYQSILNELKTTKKIIIENTDKDNEQEYIITDEEEIKEVVELCSKAIKGWEITHDNTLPWPKIFKFYDEFDKLIVDYDFVCFRNFSDISKFYAPLPDNQIIELSKKYSPENWILPEE